MVVKAEQHLKAAFKTSPYTETPGPLNDFQLYIRIFTVEYRSNLYTELYDLASRRCPQAGL